MVLRLILLWLSLASFVLFGKGAVTLVTAYATPASPLPAARIGRSSKPRRVLHWGQLIAGICTILVAVPAALITSFIFLYASAWSGDSPIEIAAQCVGSFTIVGIATLALRRLNAWTRRAGASESPIHPYEESQPWFSRSSSSS